MEKNKRQKLLYEGLKHDEMELLEWYRENPLSVYIEISLRVMADIGIITEEQYKTLDKTYLLKQKKESFGYSCLTGQKQFYEENIPGIAIEKGTIDEVITMMIKGEAV